MAQEKSNKGKCGIVMPISEIDGLIEQHWLEVKDLIVRAATASGFEAELVSADTDVGVIQKRIVRNLYECPVVVCDVSAKNPNVMLELGMRLAFDKPVVLIKDDKTTFSFDTSPLEHLIYPRSLRFAAMEEFIDELKSKILRVTGKSGEDSFLKSFGAFKVAELDVESVPAQEAILGELAELRSMIVSQQFRPASYSSTMRHGRPENKLVRNGKNSFEVFLIQGNEDAKELIGKLSRRTDIVMRLLDEDKSNIHLEIEIRDPSRSNQIRQEIQADLDELIPF